jgi:integrase
MLQIIQLPHGCYCSSFSVHPKNWKTKKASLKVEWYIHYRFHDPLFKDGKHKYGKLRIVKNFINTLTTVEARQAMIEAMMENELDLLLYKGFNPITGIMKEEDQVHYEIEPMTPFAEALRATVPKLDVVREQLIVTRSCVKYFIKGAEQLRLDKKPIMDIRCRHITMILDHMQSQDKKFSNAKYNRYRANLGMIFKKLLKLGAVESNQATLVERKKQIRKIRTTLTMEDRSRVDAHLRENNPVFHRFMHIFFHSGVRETELLSIQGKDVDLPNQRYKVVLKKGREYREVYKIIKDIAVPYWTEAMKDCKADDFLFSKGLVPGAMHIHSSQVGRRWRRWVKDKLGIEADFYSLKHSNTTEIVDLLDAENAAKLNSHTSEAMVRQIYDVRSLTRRDDRLKKVNNTFV